MGVFSTYDLTGTRCFSIREDSISTLEGFAPQVFISPETCRSFFFFLTASEAPHCWNVNFSMASRVLFHYGILA